ncbi:nucleotidyltransferase family protein [Candidatus Margulisiibacteriota bacterium]
MLKDTIIPLIDKYFRTCPVNKAYLFGSVARGEESKDSDIDVLVELDRTKPIGLEFIEMQITLQKLLHRKVDLVTNKALSKYIKPYIDKEKVLIYEK